MLTRRELIQLGIQAGAVALLPSACSRAPEDAAEIWVNDIHSQLNRTRVMRIEKPTTVKALQEVVGKANHEGRSVSIMAGRHAMGGQQFGSDTVLIDAGGMQGIYEIDLDAGQVEVGAGTQWPRLVSELSERQKGENRNWGIVQKQTGADRLSIGGALSANAHGRGLTYQPIVQDVESLTLIDAQGALRRCSRKQNSDIFRLAIGGYGLFGVIASARLRLRPRTKVERVVELIDSDDLSRRFSERIADGFLFGDFQFSTEANSESLLREGVFSCYRPVPADTPIPAQQKSLSREDWLELIELTHHDQAKAYRQYSSYYLKTSGQVYWSDTHQLSTYVDDYHQLLGSRLGSQSQGTEMISEIYVPREALADFLEDARADFLEHQVNLIYGTIRLIEKDDVTFLAWARQSWACVIFNIHTAHDPESLATTSRHFRRLIDLGRKYAGSYFLTYHRWATREQVLACYPQFPEFMAHKLRFDPQERFQSNWYRHYRKMFS